MANPSLRHEYPSSKADPLTDVAARAARDSALFASVEARDARVEASDRKKDSRDAGWQIYYP